MNQTKSVSKYRDDSRIVVLTIGGIHDGEKLDRFIQGLKHHVRIEVLKLQAKFIGEWPVSLSTLIVRYRRCLSWDTKMDSTATKIAIRQQTLGQRTWQRKRRLVTSKMKNYLTGDENREQGIWKEACFYCHEVGFRPHLCLQKVNNIVIDGETETRPT